MRESTYTKAIPTGGFTSRKRGLIGFLAGIPLTPAKALMQEWRRRRGSSRAVPGDAGTIGITTRAAPRLIASSCLSCTDGISWSSTIDRQFSVPRLCVGTGGWRRRFSPLDNRRGHVSDVRARPASEIKGSALVSRSSSLGIAGLTGTAACRDDRIHDPAGLSMERFFVLKAPVRIGVTRDEQLDRSLQRAQKMPPSSRAAFLLADFSEAEFSPRGMPIAVAQTLNRKFITSPSCTTYSLPSARIFPASFAPCSPL